MAEAPEAVFLPLGDGCFEPTELARGPWSPDHQHGGAPAGLIVRELERVDTFQPMRLARITYDFLGPVPIAELELRTELLRPGKRVQWVGATMLCEGRPIVRAIAFFVRVKENGTPVRDMPDRTGPGPEASRNAMTMIDELPTMFAGDAVEIRISSDKAEWVDPGPGSAWFRLKVPLVAGEKPTPQQRACSAADFGNGISAPLSWFDWLFVNGDLTVNLTRRPDGEWIELESVTRLSGDGTGHTETRMSDGSGPIGTAAQSLFVEQQAGASDFGKPA